MESDSTGGDTERLDLMIVDDDENFRAIIEVALWDEPFNMRLYPDGDTAIAEMTKTALPDLAILDVQMPGTNGIELCRWIKERTGKRFIPVILLTSQSELEDKIRGLDCGADEYITKPCPIAELKARVRAMLRIKALTDELRETQSRLAKKEKELLVMQLAGAAAHELGQPLTTVLLSCQLLLKQQTNPVSAPILDDIVEQCNRMKEVLNKLNSLDTYRVRDYVGGLSILDLDTKK